MITCLWWLCVRSVSGSGPLVMLSRWGRCLASGPCLLPPDCDDLCSAAQPRSHDQTLDASPRSELLPDYPGSWRASAGPGQSTLNYHWTLTLISFHQIEAISKFNQHKPAMKIKWINQIIFGFCLSFLWLHQQLPITIEDWLLWILTLSFFSVLSKREKESPAVPA